MAVIHPTVASIQATSIAWRSTLTMDRCNNLVFQMKVVVWCEMMKLFSQLRPWSWLIQGLPFAKSKCGWNGDVYSTVDPKNIHQIHLNTTSAWCVSGVSLFQKVYFSQLQTLPFSKLSLDDCNSRWSGCRWSESCALEWQWSPLVDDSWWLKNHIYSKMPK